MSDIAAGVKIEGFLLTHRYLTPATPPTRTNCKKIHIPDDPRILAALVEMLALLSNPDVWQEETGAQSAIQTSAQITRMYFDMLESTCDIGTIHPYATATIPDNMLPCNGSIFANVDYPELAARIHETFKPDSDHFQTPNLNGRSIVGSGIADNDAGVIEWVTGDKFGSDEITLTMEQMPAHTHLDEGHSHTESGSVASEAVLTAGVPLPSAVPIPAVTGTGMANLANAGGDEPHSNTPPGLALPFGIIYR